MGDTAPIKSSLQVDLSEIAGRLRALDERGKKTEEGALRTEKKIVEIERRHGALDRSIHRIEHKLQHVSRTFFKSALSGMAGDMLGSSEAEGGGSFAKGFGVAATTGLVYGGLPGGMTAAAFYLIHQLEHHIMEGIRQIKELEKRIVEHSKKQAEFDRQLTERNQRSRIEEEKRNEEFKEKLRLDIARGAMEETYQTAVALAAQELGAP